MSSVKEIAKKINRAWKEEILVSGNFVKEVDRLPMGDLGFDYPVYGGLPEGCLVTFSGVEHSGKTTAACQAMAQYQRKYPNKTCVYVDAENTLLTQYEFIQKMTGLKIDDDSFLRYDTTGKAAEEIFSDIIQLEEADDIGMIVIDSAPALISKADLDNDFEKDNGMRASISKSLGKFIKQMLMYLPKRNNILLIINQVRVDGVSFTGAKIYSEPAGYSLQYYPSLKIRFGTRNYTLGDKVDLSPTKGEDADGFRLKFSVVKNRLGPNNRGGGFLTYRLDSGLDYMFDMLEVAIKFGYIKRPTAMSYEIVNLDTGETYLDEEGNPLKFVGKAKLVDYINSHKEFKEEYFKMLTRHVSSAQVKVDLLDQDSLNEILEQEAAITHTSFESNPTNEEEDE